MRPMRRRESVIDVNVAQRRQRLGEGSIVLFFAGVIAKVLKQGDIARLHRRDDRLGDIANTVIGPGDRLIQQSGEGLANRLETHLWNPPAFGPIEVGEQHDFGARLGKEVDGLERAKRHLFLWFFSASVGLTTAGSSSWAV